MYRLILVDDEEDVRQGVCAEIDWEACGFQIVGTAENGKEATELIERLLPDLVVTDIKMPFMDGLQLAEWVKAHDPTTRVIILTGFDEFEYAQKAIKLQIDEYVLKPFSTSELIDVLEKVKEQMDAEANQKKNVELLLENYRRSLPILREAFLSSLVTRKLMWDEVYEKAARYDIQLHTGPYTAAVISLDHSEKRDDEMPLFAVKNIAEEEMNEKAAGIVFLHDDAVVLLFSFAQQSNGENSGMQRIVSFLEQIRQNISKYTGYSVSVGVGSLAHDLAAISDSYEGARYALDYRTLLGMNRVICIDDLERRALDRLHFDERMEVEIVRCIKLGTIDEMHTCVERMFADIADQQASIRDFQLFLLECMTTIVKAARSAGVEADLVWEEKTPLFAPIQQFRQLQEAKDWIIGICTHIMGAIAAGRQTGYKQLVEQARLYTRAHFHDPELSIQKVCQELHISTGYFSSIFKRETKQTYGGYLLQLRMEMAQEYLRTTDWKTFEIAEKVGYPDSNYFSFCFRKHVGMTPKDYRNGARGVQP
ncbi:response regulator [Brevibacillus fluminis]|uniref:Response regulator n=1 Tax=Brevibacillus fluminis TaxID=511487 RepID=A0A3M8DGU7_9BACL|nr:response regulator [Brevibacillus fluminis]RNB87322.1 response regulator [Brevibacillus fluminis]